MNPVLFVGGPLHATTWTPPESWTSVEQIPPTYLDPVTGCTYQKVPFGYDVPSPLDPNVIVQRWALVMYLFTEAAISPEVAAAAVSDSVVRWWCMNMGELDQTLAHGPGNGKMPAEALTVYVATCGECVSGLSGGAPLSLQFASMTDRARWMRAHIDTLGHKPGFEDVTPVPASETAQGGTDDGSTGVSDVQKG